MKRRVLKLFTIVILSIGLINEVYASLENNTIQTLRYDLWYQGVQKDNPNSDYDPPEMVEADAEAEEILDYPVELMLPLSDHFGEV